MSPIDDRPFTALELDDLVAGEPHEEDRWRPIPIESLTDESDPAAWVWHGYLAAGSITSLTGLWKVGKTTLITALIKAISSASGEFGGSGVGNGRVLVVTEESRRHWKRRRENFQIGTGIDLIVRPFLGRPSLDQWTELVESVARDVQRTQYTLVVVAPLFNLWPVKDENDAAQAISALSPLHRITEAGAAVLLLCHPKKGDAGEGQATRGSGAIGGFVDVILELRRFDASSPSDTRRVLKSYSRFDETPGEVVLNYQAGDFVPEGARREVMAADMLQEVLDLLPRAEAEALAIEAVHSRWSGTPISKETLRRRLQDGVDRGRINQVGLGTRGQPRRFYCPSSATNDDEVTRGDLEDSTRFTPTPRGGGELSRIREADGDREVIP
ncbi:MAG: AAA family ATPase [Deltaproteobacteria bacterium]